MGESAKLKTCCFKLDPEIVKGWKETITKNETIKKRVERLMLEDIEKHKK